ncbi:phosphatase PAP2 family protein [Acinetobacter indicus]|uniref:phosphatase PAP2 family protein n=1 Tax=Acinetobacter indicus TaxID=756892 RepID=UPI002578E875|nr:phosphatase PAP2 family protein [Acinetobacter indicus]MDM1285071.1 phosphatase PAP2 family protein [Acinetobacter indicus]
MPNFLLYLGGLLCFFSVLMLYVPALTALDSAIVDWFSQHRNEMLNSLMTGLSVVGGMPFVLFLSSLWCLYLARQKEYANIVLVSIGLMGSFATAWIFKYLIARERPPEMYHLVNSYGASFPSAHSFYAATLGCLAIYVSMQHPAHKAIVICAVMWMLLMGISRVYLGVHFPSDVLSGWSISFIWITLLYLILIKYSQRKPMNNF